MLKINSRDRAMKMGSLLVSLLLTLSRYDYLVCNSELTKFFWQLIFVSYFCRHKIKFMIRSRRVTGIFEFIFNPLSAIPTK